MTTPPPEPRPGPILLLLPPSEGKREGGDGEGWSLDDGEFGAALSARRRRVVAALKRARGGNAKLLGVKGAALERARSVNAALVGAPTCPAWQRYSGVVWDHLDPASLADRSSIVVVTGLHGVVGAEDPVPDYRLKMSASLPKLGKLSTWWRPAVSTELDRRAAGRFVVDLLPQEHRAAYLPGPRVDGVSVAFVERGGSGRAVGHFAKAAKGLLARHLLTEVAAGRDPLDAIWSWSHDGFELVVAPLNVAT